MKNERQLVVTRHLLNLKRGVFCLMAERGMLSDEKRKWPGIQVLPVAEFSHFVDILSFRTDGWLSDEEDLVLVRVQGQRAAVYVIFCHFDDEPEVLPHLEVRLLRELTTKGRTHELSPIPVHGFEPKKSVLAHIENQGDITGGFGDWIGDPKSFDFIEGFAIVAPIGIEPSDLSYQAVLGPTWASPWVSSGEFCGSRGMTLALLGLRIRLTGSAAKHFKLSYSASFSGGVVVGPVGNDTACQSDLNAPMVAIKVFLIPNARLKNGKKRKVAKT